MPFQPFLSLPKQDKNSHWLWSACSPSECRIPACQIVGNYFAIHTGGKWYYLSGSGAMKTGWVKLKGTWYYLKSSGAMATGWYKVGSSWYWSNSSGAMAANRWVGNYYLKGSGAMTTNQWIGRYHVNASGKWDKTR